MTHTLTLHGGQNSKKTLASASRSHRNQKNFPFGDPGGLFPPTSDILLLREGWCVCCPKVFLRGNECNMTCWWVGRASYHRWVTTTEYPSATAGDEFWIWDLHYSLSFIFEIFKLGFGTNWQYLIYEVHDYAIFYFRKGMIRKCPEIQIMSNTEYTIRNIQLYNTQYTIYNIWYTKYNSKKNPASDSRSHRNQKNFPFGDPGGLIPPTSDINICVYTNI